MTTTAALSGSYDNDNYSYENVHTTKITKIMVININNDHCCL